MTDNVTNLPTPGVVLDLDAMERPAKDVKPPFVVRVGGKDITFADPSELDWKDLVDINHPGQLVGISLSRADRDHILTTDLPTWKFGELMDSYYTHYDFDKKIEEARRRQAFERSIGGQG